MLIESSELAVSAPCGFDVFVKRDGRNEGIVLLVARLHTGVPLNDAVLLMDENWKLGDRDEIDR
jgi:hypothetical protein